MCIFMSTLYNLNIFTRLYGRSSSVHLAKNVFFFIMSCILFKYIHIYYPLTFFSPIATTVSLCTIILFIQPLCLCAQIENLRVECSSKATEIYSLQSRIDSIQNQRSDLEQHIEILKQQLQTKDSNIDLVKTEVRITYRVYIYI